MTEKRLMGFRAISIIIFWVTFIGTCYFESFEWLLYLTFMSGIITSNIVWGFVVDG